MRDWLGKGVWWARGSPHSRSQSVDKHGISQSLSSPSSLPPSRLTITIHPNPAMPTCPSSPTLSSLPLAFPGLSIHSPPPSNPGDPVTPSALGPDSDQQQQPNISSYFQPPAAESNEPPILRLPQELLELVGLSLCRLRPSGPPGELVNLLLTCRRFNLMLGKGNDGLYADLFRERFDYKGVCRRWES